MELELLVYGYVLACDYFFKKNPKIEISTPKGKSIYKAFDIYHQIVLGENLNNSVLPTVLGRAYLGSHLETFIWI